MRPIGGYFELELEKGSRTYHKTKALKSGRAALHFILKNENAKNVFIPFYTCNALLEAFEVSGVSYQFYEIDSALEPVHLPQLKEQEYFLYINYFDLKRKAVQQLETYYGNQLIVDNSQAFFHNGLNISWSFNSCRKFFGVPDGSYLYPPTNKQLNLSFDKNSNYTTEHLLKRFNGDVHGGYPFFQENETKCNAEIKEMSLLSEQLLSLVDYDACIQKRKQNFSFLHQELSHLNTFGWNDDHESVAMAYPFLPAKKIDHSRLWEQNIFIPVLWQDVKERNRQGFQFEKNFADSLLPLPIDHRYNINDMKNIINFIKWM